LGVLVRPAVSIGNHEKKTYSGKKIVVGEDQPLLKDFKENPTKGGKKERALCNQKLQREQTRGRQKWNIKGSLEK